MLTRKFYAGLFIFLFMLGCNNPDSAPELRDPVYQDLKSEESKAKKSIDGKTKELEEARVTFDSLPDNDYQKKLTRAEIYKIEKEISKLKQQMKFYKVSADSRQIYARKEYLEYFKQGKAEEWPHPDTKAIYKRQKEAAVAPKQWTRGLAAEKTTKKQSSGH